jgi:hypothetical protein
LISNQPYFKDLTGKRFGKLLVLEHKGRDKGGFTVWEVQCDCGVKKIIRSSNLRHGMKSCGCAKIKPSGKANMGVIYAGYRIHAKQKNRIFNLTKDQFEYLTKQNCFYCGNSPSKIKNQKGLNGEYIYNGIDRIDNTKGYTLDNCVPCCSVCNTFKSNRNKTDFLDLIKKIYDYRKINE